MNRCEYPRAKANVIAQVLNPAYCLGGHDEIRARSLAKLDCPG